MCLMPLLKDVSIILCLSVSRLIIHGNNVMLIIIRTHTKYYLSDHFTGRG
jgi:hypothetical protein